MQKDGMKHLFKYGTPFPVDSCGLAGHTLILGPTRLGMSCLTIFSKFAGRQTNGHPPSTSRQGRLR